MKIMLAVFITDEGEFVVQKMDSMFDLCLEAIVASAIKSGIDVAATIDKATRIQIVESGRCVEPFVIQGGEE